MRYSAIWIKTATLISILLMSSHKADMTLDEVESVLEFEIATDSHSVTINPNGPLNFLCGYIYQKMDCMHSKRFFAPEINTDYSVQEARKTSSFNEESIYSRNEQKDKAYTALPGNKMSVYAEKYHNHLIELFPSPTGDITIETRGNQSFVQFLRAKTTEKHSLHILALLLLFSEGVNIPIDVSNTVLKVYETDKKDEIYFKVPMAIPWLNTKENKVETFQQKKVKQLISFFQENATDSKVLSLMVDKCIKEEVISGKFLNSPKFLIQSYIFWFIDSAERATEFIQTVHTMVEKYTPKTETPSKDYSIYDRLFKPAGSKAEIDYMALMKSTQDILNVYRVFPFTDSTQIPAYTSVPRYNRKLGIFSTNHLENYSNCVESMILSLFCCLAYDPSDFTYKTDHMGNVSEELEEFFSLENQPFDTTKGNFQKKWCKVVADLKEPSIVYCNDRNEIDCGLINMLLVIAEVINASEEEKKKILGFSERLKEKEGVLEDDLCNTIETYTKTLLTSLSKAENVEIDISRLTSDKYTDGKYDIYGKITMLFEHNGIKNTIVLGIFEGHSTIDMEPTVMDFKDCRMEKLNEIAEGCKNKTEFVGNLFAAFIDYETRKIDTPEKNKEFIKAQVRTTIENNYADINRLLLIKKICSLDYIIDLISCSIIYSIGQELSPNHSLIRFTSNILGSTELGNSSIQIIMLPPIVFAGLHNKSGSNLNYPNIKLTEKRYNFLCSESSHSFFIEYILYCDMDVFIRWIKLYIDNLYHEEDIAFIQLFDPLVNRRICQRIFKNGTMKYSHIIDNFMIQKHDKKEDEVLSIVHFIWIVYLCIEKCPNLELIKANLDSIREIKFITKKCAWYIEASSMFNQSFQTLSRLKNELCKDQGDIAKLNLVMEVLKSM
ncbi:uncharacterized protein NESG_01892 [Nematocida ausubeli]|uniref:Uncharacterized protein n=1 Tax=Nematocida ausubeli (strain ATCC PRA-371 / ERTm2) TaxID=1913371 RepID=A0A086J185_NEMA1|nr:uncharacterized protein NESG_01892 [Nematocida ausubeli]KFG25903.1 hypothetical protein NESG_01892 [Nematocida ausubeli]